MDSQCPQNFPFCDTVTNECKGKDLLTKMICLILNQSKIIRLIYLHISLECGSDSHCPQSIPFCELETNVCKGSKILSESNSLISYKFYIRF